MSPEPNDFWIPNANVLVNAAGELVIKVELAAMAKEDIKITIDGQCLTLSGRRLDPDGKDGQYLVLEINHGRFESVLDVPKEFDLSRAQTTHQNGMLRIVAPRRTLTS
jgi:HSP20 family molecular chaperone IbpA